MGFFSRPLTIKIMIDYLCIKIGAIIGTFLLIYLLVWNAIGIVEGLSLLMLFLTFLAILWYSKETQGLKEISIKRPCLSFYIKDNKIKLKNYGEGVARNIEIKVNNKTVYEIPLISGNIRDCALTFPEDKNELLKKCKDEIIILYHDISRETKYTTITQWDDSVDNRDKCKIIDYK